MAAFPSTIPADVVEVISYIRWWLGNLSVDVVSDQDLTDIINNNIAKYPDNLCKITYYSTVDLLYWLIRQDSVNSGATDVSGAVTKRKERRGSTQIEVEYQESDSALTTGWEDILADLLKNPNSIGCTPLSDQEDTPYNAPIIGGADINGFEAGFDMRRRFGTAIKNNRYGYNNNGRKLF